MNNATTRRPAPMMLAVCASLGLGAAACAQPAATPTPTPTPASGPRAAQPETAPVDKFAADPTAVLGFTLNDIEGEATELGEYSGKVVLMVNVASKCGLTPQYEALEAVYEKYKDKGLVVLGFPANNFKEQEPGTDGEILEFCRATYGVKFPMFGKISVIGEDQHPLYKKLAVAMAEQGGEPTWNFTKYLVDRTGHVVRRIDPRTTPDDASVIAEIEKLLAQPAPEQQEEVPA